MPARLKVFFDGGYRPHGGGMETAVVIRGQAHVRCDLGVGTSMAAEWLALRHALHLLRELGEGNAVILGDAVAVIGQANGTLTARGDNIGHRDAVRDLVAGIDRPVIRYIKRSQNLAGIALARLHDR